VGKDFWTTLDDHYTTTHFKGMDDKALCMVVQSFGWIHHRASEVFLQSLVEACRVLGWGRFDARGLYVITTSLEAQGMRRIPPQHRDRLLSEMVEVLEGKAPSSSLPPNNLSDITTILQVYGHKPRWYQ